MAWYVDHGLAVLNQQMRDKYPGIVIGTIGDPRHAKSASDHNPEADGSVDASDFMIGPSFGESQAESLFQTLIRNRDKRIAYVIYNRRIVSSTNQPWVIRPYTGSDPHTGHIHLSVNDNHKNDKGLWTLDRLKHTYLPLDAYSLPELTYGMDDDAYDGYRAITRLQKLLNVTADGIYRDETAAAVKRATGNVDNGKRITIAHWVTIAGLSRT